LGQKKKPVNSTEIEMTGFVPRAGLEPAQPLLATGFSYQLRFSTLPTNSEFVVWTFSLP
jgi:hypothetical protein